MRCSFGVGLIVLAGCVQTVPNPEGGRDGSHDAFDAAGRDGGPDANDDSDVIASECLCPDPRKSICLLDEDDRFTCVECTEARNPCPTERPACGPEHTCVECTPIDLGKCGGEKPVCLVGGAVCVECNESAECPEDRPACTAANACGGCTADAQCERFGKVCDEFTGRCEGCTVDSEAMQCGANSCNPATKACTQTARGSVTQCKSCVADSECEPNHRCVEMFFGAGPSRTALGGRCMKRLAAGCAPPYGSSPIRRASLSGAPAEDYCGISEARTSCDAILDLVRGKTCPGGDDASCGAPGGVCRRVNGVADLCTYPCENNLECPTNAACPDNGADRHCGKN